MPDIGMRREPPLLVQFRTTEMTGHRLPIRPFRPVAKLPGNLHAVLITLVLIMERAQVDQPLVIDVASLRRAPFAASGKPGDLHDLVDRQNTDWSDAVGLPVPRGRRPLEGIL